MSAELERLFPEYMGRGDLDDALALYEPTLAFWKREGRVNVGIESLREELAPFAGRKSEVRFATRKVARSGNLALVYDEWRVDGSAIQIVRRQVDRWWKDAAGDPFAGMTGSAS